MARKDSKPLLILHVEDDENDAILFRKACERAGLPAQMHRVEAADVAKAYLLGEGIYVDRVKYPLPQIIVLDLKMPRMDGFEFLKWLRGSEAFSSLPVLVFTASISREDRSRAIAEGANSYFIKPASFEALVKMVEGFGIPNEDRWIEGAHPEAPGAPVFNRLKTRTFKKRSSPQSGVPHAVRFGAVSGCDRIDVPGLYLRNLWTAAHSTN